jgi:hypothetical protein
MRTFLLIERPQHFDDDPLPSGQGWTSIGQFYDFIRQGLLTLVKELGEDKVFCGRRERQVGPEDFYNSGGEAFPVTDLTSALLALRVVTEQGEGLHDSIFDSDDQLFGEDRQVAHYFRFNEILTGRTYGPHDTPNSPPTGPEIDVRWEDAYRIDPNASVADYARYQDKAVYEHAVAFNDAYAELLAHLEIAFNGMPRFMILGVPAMLRLRDLAERLNHKSSLPNAQERSHRPRKSTARGPAELGCTYRDAEDRRRSIHPPRPGRWREPARLLALGLFGPGGQRYARRSRRVHRRAGAGMCRRWRAS